MMDEARHHLRRSQTLRMVVLLTVGVWLGMGAAAAPAEPVLEPKAMEILKAACDRLAAARSMAFTAVATYESPSRLGPPLAYATRSEVALRRPDRLRVVTPGDGPASALYYD